MKAGFLKTAAMGLGILGASVFSLAGPANAATYINLYGASAQFNFWSNYATTFMTSTTGPHCTSVAGPYITSDKNSAVVIGTGCSGITDASNAPSGYDNTGNKIFFTYSSKASWDGVDAVLGIYDEGNNGVANPCSDGSQRQVAYCGTGGVACGSTGAAGSATYECEPVSIGTSDVEAAAFTQQSYGTLDGPADPNDTPVYHNFGSNGIDVSSLPASGHYVSTFDTVDAGGKIQQPETPLAYPFSLYVNPAVKSTRCNNTTDIAGTNYNGMPCVDDSQCGGSVGGHTYCPTMADALTIDNLSRLQVVALYSGGIANWNDFGASYVNLPVTLCLRHAGSGTSATLDWAVMEGNGWGASLTQGENRASTDAPPYIYFNDGTSNMKNCLSWSNGDSAYGPSAGYDALAAGEVGGGVGYMDSDNVDTSDYVQVKLDGVRASRMAMHDGLYEYWTINRMYVPAGLPKGIVDFYGQMLVAINNPANITNGTVGGARGNYYGAAVELNFPKGTSSTFPYAYSPASNPANPN